MLDWWNSLQQQERQIISLGSIILVVCLCYIGIWEPLQIKQQQLTKHLNHQEQLYRWVINASHQAKQIQQSQPKSQQIGRAHV